MLRKKRALQAITRQAEATIEDEVPNKALISSSVKDFTMEDKAL